jgi:hypothetical protein
MKRKIWDVFGVISSLAFGRTVPPIETAGKRGLFSRGRRPDLLDQSQPRAAKTPNGLVNLSPEGAPSTALFPPGFFGEKLDLPAFGDGCECGGSAASKFRWR